MDMSTYTVEDGDCCCIAVPPPSMDTSTHTQLKMEIVAPPPSIDRSTQVETVSPLSIPLLFHPGLQVELLNSLNYF